MNRGDDMRSADEIFRDALPSISFAPVNETPKSSGKVLGREFYHDSAGRTILGDAVTDQMGGGSNAPTPDTYINTIAVEARVSGFNSDPSEESCAQSFDFTWSHTWTREPYSAGSPPTGNHFQIDGSGVLIHPVDLGDFAAAISTVDINATMTCGRVGPDAPSASNAFNFDVFFNSSTGNIEAGANGALLCTESGGGAFDPCGFGDDGVSFTPFTYDLTAPHIYNLDDTVVYSSGIKELRLRMTITLS